MLCASKSSLETEEGTCLKHDIKESEVDTQRMDAPSLQLVNLENGLRSDITSLSSGYKYVTKLVMSEVYDDRASSTKTLQANRTGSPAACGPGSCTPASASLPNIFTRDDYSHTART